MEKQLRWTAQFYRWFVKQPRAMQKRVLKLMDQGFKPVWDPARSTYRFKKS